MKYLWIFLVLNVSLILGTAAQESKPERVSDGSLIHYAGQPSSEEFSAFKKKGFDVVINIRSAHEMRFDEKAVVNKNNMIYVNIPLIEDEGIVPSAIEKIDMMLTLFKGRKILVHCASGNRVGAWAGARLVRSGTAIETAIEEAKKAGMKSKKLEEYLRIYHASLAK